MKPIAFHLILISFLLAVSLILVAGIRRQASEEEESSESYRTCGYDSCTKSDSNKLNIHLVAHTHDDVGWLKTVNEYFYGERMRIQPANVQRIINSVVDALAKNSDRKFIYVEMAFLWKWWLRQNEERREVMRQLINEGRLEIIGGGWSMNDEAVTHYQSMIDQYTWGFRRLNDTFGACARPKIGWQIDPFGHSREQASMFAQMGFDGMFFGRLDHQDKQNRLHHRTAEFIWEGSPNLGPSSDLFTVMLYNIYGPPPGFCFDILCQDMVMNDNEDSPNYNIPLRLNQFLSYVQEQAKYYRSNNVILTMGGDFTYQVAEKYFRNMDILIKYINQRNGSDFYAFYSTPSCYLKAVNEEHRHWPTKTDDFFPYSSNPHEFWTGYFTSRPTLKYYERLGNNFLQISKQLTVLTGQGDNEYLQLFREIMGVMQHHDAVTGTEKQHVADDYARVLDYNIKSNEVLVSKAMFKMTAKRKTSKPANFYSCMTLNISSCGYTERNNVFVITVYNPTSQPINTYVRVPITRGSMPRVRDHTGHDIVTQTIPIPRPVQNIPGRASKANMELLFQAENISPLGYQMFYVDQKVDIIETDKPTDDDQDLSSTPYRVNVDSNGLVTISNDNGLNFTQTFHYYECNDKKIKIGHTSGAYIFRPTEQFAEDLLPVHTSRINGPLVQEIHQTISEWVSQVIRIYNDKDYVQFEWLVGPIPVDDKIGKEVISKFSSNLKNKGEFYTDSNGREMLKRKLNYRPTWDVQLDEPIAGNYYPVPTKISIEDVTENRRFSVLTDRAQGGSSINDGEIELMLHRRLVKDDGFGVDEVLSEAAYGVGLVARGEHYVVAGDLDNVDELMLQEKDLAFKLQLRPWIFITPTSLTYDEWNEDYNMRNDGVIINTLPRNVHILTLEPWKDGEVLLRLEHVFEKGESPVYSKPATVDLLDLFPGFDIESIRETTLGANQWIGDVRRLKWTKENSDIPEAFNRYLNTDEGYTITLKCMEIRTFVLKLRHQPKW